MYEIIVLFFIWKIMSTVLPYKVKLSSNGDIFHCTKCNKSCKLDTLWLAEMVQVKKIELLLFCICTIDRFIQKNLPPKCLSSENVMCMRSIRQVLIFGACQFNLFSASKWIYSHCEPFIWLKSTEKDAMIPKWSHIECFFSTARPITVHDLDGFAKLCNKDRANIKQRLSKIATSKPNFRVNISFELIFDQTTAASKQENDMRPIRLHCRPKSLPLTTRRAKTCVILALKPLNRTISGWKRLFVKMDMETMTAQCGIIWIVFQSTVPHSDGANISNTCQDWNIWQTTIKLLSSENSRKPHFYFLNQHKHWSILNHRRWIHILCKNKEINC